jgi:hypothetical protein
MVPRSAISTRFSKRTDAGCLASVDSWSTGSRLVPWGLDPEAAPNERRRHSFLRRRDDLDVRLDGA